MTPTDIDRALTAAKGADQPPLVACHTHIGFGAPKKQDTASAHGSPLGDDEIAKVREVYGWSHAPVPDPRRRDRPWAEIGKRGAPNATSGRRGSGCCRTPSAPSSSG